MKNNYLINNEIELDISNEISVKELIKNIDRSKDFEIFEINESDELKREKNILIHIRK